MLQVIQHQKTGKITVDELPAPPLKPGGVLVRNICSLISAGTERSSVETAQASLLGKARSRPDLVRQVLDNVKREGLVATYHKVQNRLENYKELGYSSAGIVVESSCDEFKVEDRVACAGVGYASHAALVFVPRNLAVRIPDKVTFDQAAFTAVGAIAMQGVRQADVQVGECVVVIGLGLVGLLTAQILKASGCTVFGLDILPHHVDLARASGCDASAMSGWDALPLIENFTRGRGADAVIITAATTSSQPVEFALQCVRKKGRIIVVGAVGMDVPRMPTYEKELEIRMSCSYGPGRYDSQYEASGHDYPTAYVRWTENRNMEALLDLIAAGRLNVDTLTTHKFGIGDALAAYDILTGKTRVDHLGILISYPNNNVASDPRKVVLRRAEAKCRDVQVVGVIGAGNHTQSCLLPPLARLGAQFEVVATSKPVNAGSVGKKFGFSVCATDAAEVYGNRDVTLVVIGSRHDSHAHYVVEALAAGKDVFVEKPLAITAAELDRVVAAHEAASQRRTPLLLVGYNRRFSAAMRAIKEFFASSCEPLVLTYRVNAGFQPSSSWYQDPAQGGRVVGEIGHFIDCLQFLTGALPYTVYAVAPDDPGNRYGADNVQVSMTLTDGSVGQISYFANGASALSKEYLEVSSGGKSATMDSFRRVVLFDGRKEKSLSFSGDKGHAEEMKALLAGARSGNAPILLESLVATSRASFAIMESLRTGGKVMV
jgi:predicted dehydrogenase/threonine dehydrogenase-like Zn-dependent dehydrogenase